MFSLAWLLLLAPLLSAAAVLVFFRKSEAPAIACSISACAIAFLVSLGIWAGVIGDPSQTGWLRAPGAIPWMHFESINFTVEIGMYLNPLSKGMLLVVTGVGLMVHIFAIGYMAHDAHKPRFFGELSLFMFAMLGIVLANNLVMMYIFWELVGLASYLLIGFWFHRPSADLAARKAFLCNRLGDFGFLLGILILWQVTGTFYLDEQSFPGAVEALKGFTGDQMWLVTTIGLLLFCGCVGKSAQFPLHVWLPGSMEGPTPVSALLHAATMVAAGVYMLVRIFPILELSPDTLYVIGSVGAFMTLFAAVIGTQQADIKRILAYSTLSQLGYMVLAVGAGAPGSAMFHLSTHACFKSLLFLGAGSVIVANHENQDIWKMGGLWKRMPVTFITFLIASCALAGLPFFAGFYSKDPIIDLSGEEGTGKLWWYWFSLIAAAITAYYIFRGVVVAFLGKPKSEIAEHAKESPLVMIVPLCCLAFFAFFGGYPILGWEHYYLEATHQAVHVPDVAVEPMAYLTAFVVFAIGAGLAFFLYRGRMERPDFENFTVITWFRDKFYVDEFYDKTILLVQSYFAKFLAWLDKWIIGGFLVRGVATVCTISGEVLRLFQTGSLQAYAFIFSLGAAVLIYLLLLA